MKTITVPGDEYFDNSTGEFRYGEETKVGFEHSLATISKWEAKHHKSFLSSSDKGGITNDEMQDYLRCMIVDGTDPEILKRFTPQNMEELMEYIKDPATATTIHDNRKSKSSKKQIITSELVYYWMISYNIPVEFEHWHIKRLLTLIELFSIKNDEGNKMSQKQTMQSNAALNAARKKAMHSKG